LLLTARHAPNPGGCVPNWPRCSSCPTTWDSRSLGFPVPAGDAEGRLAGLWDQGHEDAAALGAPIAGPAASELIAVLEELNAPGPFLALSHGDAESNNILVRESGPADARLIDGARPWDRPPLPGEGTSGPFGMIMNLIFALVMRDISDNRRISPNWLPRSLRVAGGRRRWTDGTREDDAESAASSV
jgi:hypothetical protein